MQIRRLKPDELIVGDKINGHEEGWLTVISIDRGGSKYESKYGLHIEVETANGEIKTIYCVKHAWGWSDVFDVVRLRESVTNSLKHKKGCDTMVKRLRESKDYRDVILDKYKFRHYLVGSQYQLWNDADFDKVISALRNMEKVRDEVGRLRASMFVDKCVREADANAGITDATYPDYTEVIMQYPELKAIADKYGLEYYIEGKRRLRSGSRLTESADDKGAIIQKFEDYGFYQDDPSYPRYFYDGMPYRFYATYNSEDDVACIEFNPAGNAVEVYYADINSVDDADNFLQKLYDWEEYDTFDLLEMGLIAFGFRKDGAWSYIGQNDFGEDIRVDFNEDTMTLLDDGYGESQTLSVNDGFDEFLAK